jgi:uncharacterized damage-inducible protein DinB
MSNDLPVLMAAAGLLDRSFGALRTAVEGLTAEQLNSRLMDGTNPLAVIVEHALASTTSWISLAVGADLPARDRPAEFQVRVEDVTAFLADFDARRTTCLRLLAGADAWDGDRVGFARWTSEPDEPVSAAWALLHALEHLSEHVGQAELTRQLLG